MAGIVALITVWAAFAVFPAPAATAADASSVAGIESPVAPATAARQALADTLVLLPVMTCFILDASALVSRVLIVVVPTSPHNAAHQGTLAERVLASGTLV